MGSSFLYLPLPSSLPSFLSLEEVLLMLSSQVAGWVAHSRGESKRNKDGINRRGAAESFIWMGEQISSNKISREV